ncbi:phosphoenolpyruvate synthase [Scopulibacillus darangshiensis]|uniref:Phosphoenolpyruvate synthase n=1 Tax=Scopulibacillus darangshiensis TaxID=442528 RepID=A0A4R2NBH7_9BACL|nr:phenylalanine--tRNA ligase beta subunit-related protein [Scopulibacillus darangshiensis]TCP18322.1 phosphoenolpyruvate synthase [Scopulibacillus darangshiensis]
MIHASISDTIKHKVPDFKVGLITYHDITIGVLPQLFGGHFSLFQEEIKLTFEEKSVTDLAGVSEWRKVFKSLGTDPSRYRPSHEALYRRLKKGQSIPSIHSAVDINNFFSLKYEIPLGIYDLGHLDGNVHVKIGGEQDEYEGIIGRVMSMNGKLLSADDIGAFGSPIVDSRRSMVTDKTKHALHIVYLRPTMAIDEASQLLKAIADMFTQVHGGSVDYHVIQ